MLECPLYNCEDIELYFSKIYKVVPEAGKLGVIRTAVADNWKSEWDVQMPGCLMPK